VFERPLVSESRLYQPVKRYLDGRFIIGKEVKIGSKIVDVFAISRDKGECVAVELKVSDWKKALRQAATYQVFADFCYVALHHSATARAMKHEAIFKELGVGLLSVKVNASVQIEPAPSRFVSREIADNARQQILDHETPRLKTA